MLDLREIMRRWVTGVSIVTVENEGIRHGATVSSLASISVDPPFVTVTLAKGTRTHQMMKKAGLFGVTILSGEQQSLSERFSGAVSEEHDRFEGVEYFDILEHIPVLNSGLAALGCRIVHSYEMANSTLFVGEVIASQLGEDQPPLVYVNRTYRRLEEA
jgi:flavin reductase (DIM6/NTAB) family NADH-FMN oxidoreductase RutF